MAEEKKTAPKTKKEAAVKKVNKAQPKKAVTKRPAEKKPVPKKLKLLITIVNRNKAEFYMDVLQGFEVNMQICAMAEGTATSKMRHMLGLEDEERALIFSIIREDKAAQALKTLDEKFTTVKNGKGIAYTVPLSSVMGVAIYQFLSNNRMVKENK